MSGTKGGGAKASLTNKLRHGDLFYQAIGKIGGSTPTTRPKGFAAHPELARTAGRTGGLRSRRGAAKPKVATDFDFTPKSRIPLLKRLFRRA